MRSQWALPLLLVPYAALLWTLRARTQLLGDGAVWLATVRTGEHRAYSEPLSAAAWYAFGDLVRLLGHGGDVTWMSLFSVLCGVLAAPLLAGIAMEIAGRGGRWALLFVLLLTLGVSQLYFGYIESYPAASLFLLLYLWLALRRARGADRPIVPAAALALAVVSHLSALYLLPSYVVLIATEDRPLGRKLVDLVIPIPLAAALLLALGYSPSHWVGPFRAATSGMREGYEGASLRRPYGFLSWGHLDDFMNALLLAIPVPALLFLSRAAEAARGALRFPRRDLAVLGAAAAPGFLLAAGLMTPVAPAQDWDLMSILLLPAGVLGIALARPFLSERPDTRIGAALAGISAASLLAFVLVNASEPAAVARFRAVVNDPKRVSRYGIAYGNSNLEQHFRDRGRYVVALSYARATLAAEPTNPRHWTNVGNELMALGRNDEAIPFLEEGIRRGPQRWEGRYNLGLCYMDKGRYAEAVDLFREAVRLHGNEPVIRHNLGLALYRIGKQDSAVVVWREILARWPRYAATLKPQAP